MTDYNKRSSKESAKTHELPEKVVKKDVKIKEKGAGKVIAEELINNNLNSVKSYILTDVIIPGLKRGIYDAIVGATGMILGIDTRKGTRSSSSNRISYNDFWNRKRNSTNENIITGRDGSFMIKDIYFDSRADAENVLTGLDDALDKYDGMICVADYYSLSDVSSSPIDFKWGWDDLTDAVITNTRDGYLIRLPKVRPIS